MGVVLEEGTVLPKGLVQRRWRVGPEPAPDHQLVTGGDHRERIALQVAEPADQLNQVIGPDRLTTRAIP
jgi:hypothetical protein